MEITKNFFIYPNGKIYGRKKQKYMPEQKDKKGFHYVELVKEKYYPHLLVANHFKINFHNDPVVRHRDGNKANNRLENIEYVRALRYDERVKRNPNIYYIKRDDRYSISITGINIKQTRYFIIALCYKFIFKLKIRSGLV